MIVFKIWQILILFLKNWRQFYTIYFYSIYLWWFKNIFIIYRFILLHNKNVEYKIKKVFLKKNRNEELIKLIDENIEKNKNLVNENYYYPLNDKIILLLYDISTNPTSLSQTIKKCLFQN